MALFLSYAVAVGALLLSLRRDRELSYVVTLMATLLLSPLLWDHYLTNMIIPAAFLAISRAHVGHRPATAELAADAARRCLSREGLPRAAAVTCVAGLLLPFPARAGRNRPVCFWRLSGRICATRPARA